MEEKEIKETTKSSFGYRMGELFGAVCILALTAIVAALTAKIILWMF
jgi:hypothetical protein